MPSPPLQRASGKIFDKRLGNSLNARALNYILLLGEKKINESLDETL